MSRKNKQKKSGGKQRQRQAKQKARSRSPIILAATVLVIGGAAAATWLMRGGEATSASSVHAASLDWQVPNPPTDHMQPQVARVLGEQRDAVAQRINNAEAWGELGRLYDAHELFREAEHCYRHAVALAPNNPQWAYLYAHVRDSRYADADEVIELYDRMLSIADYPPAAFRLGDALSRRGRNEEAVAAFRRAIRMDPNFGMAHRSLGQTLLALDDLAGARRHLERAEQIMSNDGITQLSLAQLYTRLGEAERARAAAERARNLPHVGSVPDPFRYDVQQLTLGSRHLNERVNQLMREGKYEAALEQLGYLLEALPNDASVHFRLGVCYEELGRTRDAIASYRRAVRIDPDHRAADRLAQLGG